MGIKWRASEGSWECRGRHCTSFPIYSQNQAGSPSVLPHVALKLASLNVKLELTHIYDRIRSPFDQNNCEPENHKAFRDSRDTQCPFLLISPFCYTVSPMKYVNGNIELFMDCLSGNGLFRCLHKFFDKTLHTMGSLVLLWKWLSGHLQWFPNAFLIWLKWLNSLQNRERECPRLCRFPVQYLL